MFAVADTKERASEAKLANEGAAYNATYRRQPQWILHCDGTVRYRPCAHLLRSNCETHRTATAVILLCTVTEIDEFCALAAFCVTI